MRQMTVGNIVRKKRKKKYLEFVNKRKASLTSLAQQLVLLLKSEGKRREQNCNSHLLAFFCSYYRKYLWYNHTSSLPKSSGHLGLKTQGRYPVMGVNCFCSEVRAVAFAQMVCPCSTIAVLWSAETQTQVPAVCGHCESTLAWGDTPEKNHPPTLQHLKMPSFN